MRVRGGWVLCALALVCSCVARAAYTEDVRVRPVSATHTSLTWTLRNTLEGPLTDHSTTFPPSIGALLRHSGVVEVVISLTQGRWDREAWAPEPLVEGPVGAELTAWFDPAFGDADEQWRALTHTLSGLLCASTNLLTTDLTDAVQAAPARPGLHYRHGVLPREALCTENTAPWLALTPCRDKAGLGALLNPLVLHAAPYHSMALRVVAQRSADGVVQRASVEGTQEMVGETSTRPLSLRGVMHVRDAVAVCPLAGHTTVHVTNPPCAAATTVPSRFFFDSTAPRSPDAVSVDGDAEVWRFEFARGESVELELASSCMAGPQLRRTRVEATKQVTGYGEERGGFVTQLRSHMDARVNVTVTSVVPWYVRTLFHTHRVTSDCAARVTPPRVEVHPGMVREGPATVVTHVQLEPGCAAWVSFEFSRPLLRAWEYMPDASRGFDIGADTVTYVRADVPPTTPRHVLFTNAVLVQLPIPDLTMPYNVITLTCSAMAASFGAFFNALTQRNVGTGKERRGKVLQALSDLVSALRRRK